ncbi:MAG TPA: DUF2490 domain-containing protein [Phnomibacter sp.]|nr:DUF2490 domain-containing protein [Phnomibacter sp.]
MINTVVKLACTCAFLYSCISHTIAQNTRIKDYNTIGWFTNFTTLHFNKKWSGHFEYQWRRNDFITTWQQSLLRTGINYQANPKLQLRAGYAWIETFAYGDIPLQAAGRTFTEHRLYQMATLTDAIGKTSISHRFMLEQRWVGRYLNSAAPKEDDFLYLNRLRYMLRLQQPLGKVVPGKPAWYAAGYNEAFIGFGKNVAENVFDQNRLALLLGCTVNKVFRIEGGYFNQTLQLAREVNNRNVFQHNNGIIINTYLSLNNKVR